MNNGFSPSRRAWNRVMNALVWAAAVLALRELEGYHTKRNTRFLRLMDDKVTNALSSDEAIDEAYRVAGVRICFGEVMPDERITPAQ